MTSLFNLKHKIDNEIPDDIILRLEKAFENDITMPDFHLQKDFYSLSRQFDQSRQRPIQWFIRRFIELILTISVFIVIFLPILVIISIAIKLESKGPIFFKQKRIGKHGKPFIMYKFRSMYKDAEEQLDLLKDKNETNELMFKMFDDPRVTKVGKFLRKFSLDELPQLINVIKGEMGLVGFRPPIPSEVEKYESWHYSRFASLPGLTGPWQVNGRSNIKNFNYVVALEYEYAKKWNLLKDMEILIKTFQLYY